MVVDGKISQVEEKLLEASGEKRKFVAEKTMAEVEERRGSGTARVGADREAVSVAQSSEGEAGLAGEQKCPGELGVVVDQKASLGDQSSMRSAGGSQNKSKAVVRKESAETQKYDSHKPKDMDVDIDENKEEVSFVPSAACDSAGWHEPRLRCDRVI